MEPAELTNLLKRHATELGFALAGACPAATPPGAHRLDEWLAHGYAGQMHYLADRRDAYRDPQRVLDGARSILMLAMNYRTAEPIAPAAKESSRHTPCAVACTTSVSMTAPDDGTRSVPATGAGQGRVSRYAWGDADYHDVIRPRLATLADMLREHAPDAQVRGVVDTAPLLEREFAQLAGLGWIGKNTLLLNRDAGSWFFLAALLTDVELAYDQPHATDHCGTCRACLDACPTQAFPQPYVLDASRCISYLTIELRDAIPTELRAGIGDWLFGCDVCQDVCPWNRHAPPADEPAFAPRPDNNPLDLIPLFDLDDTAFRARFRHTPLWRPKRRGLLRNAAIILGNHPTPAALPALARGLEDAEPLVRAACAWALGQYPASEVRPLFQERRARETNNEVVHEIDAVLSSMSFSTRSSMQENV